MTRSPLETMIDAACRCVKCGRGGAPGTCGCWITLECSKCSKRRLVERDEYDPPNAARVVIACPDCNAGDFGEAAYFDAAGKRVSPDLSPQDDAHA